MSDKQVERITRSKPIWVDMMKQKARIELARELAMIAKKHAQISSDLMRQNL